MTTYKKLTWDSYKIQVESAVRDGNGATIATTYATADALADVVDGTTPVASATSATTASKLGSSTIGGATTPVYLNAGTATACNEMMDLSSTQTVSGPKTFSRTITATANITMMQTNMASNTTVPSSTVNSFCLVRAADNTQLGGMAVFTQSSGNRSCHIKTLNIDGSTENRIELWSLNGGTAYATAPHRTYSASNTNDIVTIGSLQASTDVVHRNGNESIAGTKNLTGQLNISNGASTTNFSSFYTDRTGTNNRLMMRTVNGTNSAYLALYLTDSGTTELRMFKYVNGQWSPGLIIASE